MHKTYKLPKFFTKLKPGTARYDFTLTALDAPETRFDLICIGDPQINEAAHAVRFKREAAKDIREYSAAADIPCYAIHLGDLVNNKWALYSNMVVALQPEQTGIPVFSTIGNHDHEFPTANEKEAARNTKASSVRWTIRSTAATCISYRWTTSSTNVRRARVTPAVSAPSNTNG